MKTLNQIESESQDAARNQARHTALAHDMASALNALGEPFPLVSQCIAAGQAPLELVESMRAMLADIVPAEMVDSYEECALWSSTNEDGDPLDDGDEEIAEETRDQFLTDCAAFLGECDSLEIPWRDEMTASQFGHDFWLTRNGHGAGFWGRGLGELGDQLSECAKRQGSCDLYTGDDGLIYC